MMTYRVTGTLAGRAIDQIVCAASEHEAIAQIVRRAVPRQHRRPFAARLAWFTANVTLTATPIIGLPLEDHE